MVWIVSIIGLLLVLLIVAVYEIEKLETQNKEIKTLIKNLITEYDADGLLYVTTIEKLRDVK